MLDLLKMLNKIKNTLLTFGEDRTLTMSLFPTAIRSLGHAIKVPKTCCTVIISSPTGNGIFALPSMSWAIDTLVLSPPSLTPWIVYSCPWTAGTSPIFPIATMLRNDLTTNLATWLWDASSVTTRPLSYFSYPPSSSSRTTLLSCSTSSPKSTNKVSYTN